MFFGSSAYKEIAASYIVQSDCRASAVAKLAKPQVQGSDPDSAPWRQVRRIGSSESGSDPNFADHRSRGAQNPMASSTKARPWH
jgi:hypothetical protein